MKKLDPNSAAWQKHANKLARDFAPKIVPCEACGMPTVTNYRCTFCDPVAGGKSSEPVKHSIKLYQSRAPRWPGDPTAATKRRPLCGAKVENLVAGRNGAWKNKDVTCEECLALMSMSESEEFDTGGRHAL